jgi:hypothetical protein
MLLGLLLSGASPARAQGIGGVAGISGSSGMSGIGGISGMGGGIGGCCGLGGIGGFCGLGGIQGFGCCGGLVGYQQPVQFYTDWSRFPGRSFYHRSYHLGLANALGGTTSAELLVIAYLDRLHYFYYYHPPQKKYVGRYRPDAKDQECFAVLPLAKRKRTLAEIAENAYERWGPMPALAALTTAGPFPRVLQRPPAGLPGHNLPPDEPLDR